MFASEFDSNRNGSRMKFCLFVGGMIRDSVSSPVPRGNARLTVATPNLHSHVQHPPHSKRCLPAHSPYLAPKCNSESNHPAHSTNFQHHSAGDNAAHNNLHVHVPTCSEGTSVACKRSSHLRSSSRTRSRLLARLEKEYSWQAFPTISTTTPILPRCKLNTCGSSSTPSVAALQGRHCEAHLRNLERDRLRCGTAHYTSLLFYVF